MTSYCIGPTNQEERKESNPKKMNFVEGLEELFGVSDNEGQQPKEPQFITILSPEESADQRNEATLVVNKNSITSKSEAEEGLHANCGSQSQFEVESSTKTSMRGSDKRSKENSIKKGASSIDLVMDGDLELYINHSNEALLEASHVYSSNLSEEVSKSVQQDRISATSDAKQEDSGESQNLKARSLRRRKSLVDRTLKKAKALKE